MREDALAGAFVARGFSAEQVTAIADLLDTQSATKADLEAAAHRLDTQIARLDAKIDSVERRLESKIDETFYNLDLKLEKLETKIIEAKYDTTKWLIGAIGFQALVIIGAIAGAVAAIVRFAPGAGR
ncbi:MAG TPA: hypothetical protein VK446_11500 [Methylocystis sp.]|nr:hypothetical protein [Methylocystis sp.]